MEDYSKEDRGIFQGIKVPFCLNAIILAFMAYVIFVAGSILLGKAVGDDVAYEKIVFRTSEKLIQKLPALQRPVTEVILPYSFVDKRELDRAYEELRKQNPGKPISREDFYSPQWWKYLIFAAWFLLVWSLFAGAINRTAAYRIARDESITLKEGLSFGAQTWTSHFLAILFIAIFIAAAFFMCVLAAFILDLIPVVGNLLLIVAFIFILVAAFLIALLLAGLLFGFNMISSAIGVDKVDPFDAISRAYSYVLGRPWQTLLYTLLPLLFILFFLYFGQIFKGVAVSAVSFGMGKEFTPICDYAVKNIPFEVAFLKQDWSIKIAGIVIKIFLMLAQYFIFATAIAYWLSARTKAYFLLRKEIDGDEVEEMYLEEEEEAFESSLPAPAAPPVEEKEKKEKKKEKKEEKPKSPERKYEKKELLDLSMDELRAIADKYDIKARSKNKIVEQILKAQEE